MVAADEPIDEERMSDSTGGVVLFDTVTTTPAEVPTFPARSRAAAVSVWPPLAAVVVFHDTW